MLLRAKHETLLTSTAVRINYTRRPYYGYTEQPKFSSEFFFLPWSGFSSLSLSLHGARITQLSDLHETRDPSIANGLLWAPRIRAQIGLSFSIEGNRHWILHAAIHLSEHM